MATMKTRISLFVLFLAFLSCEEDDLRTNDKLLIGTYKGEFVRLSPWSKSRPSNVILNFTANSFSGSADQAKYPAICHGSYHIVGDEIEFTNECPWTAEFDWTLILSGKYKIKIDGNKLEMSKEVNGSIDRFELVYIK
jgi:hypothetical protein